MSTDQLILQLVNKIRNLNKHEESKYVTLAALDIKKAFDCVNHELLIDKLIKKFNFQSTSSKLIADYLSNRSQCMMQTIKYHQSKWFQPEYRKVQSSGHFYLSRLSMIS